MKRLFLGLTVGILGLVGPPSIALADYPFSFVQVTCVPELSYFSIKRFTVMNFPNKGGYLDALDPRPEVVEALRGRGIFGSITAKSHPYTCHIPKVEVPMGWNGGRPGFEVRVVGRFDEKAAADGANYLRIKDEVDVFLNGKQVGGMGLNPYSAGSGPDLIEVSPNGLVKGATLTVFICPIQNSTYQTVDLKCTKSQIVPP